MLLALVPVALAQSFTVTPPPDPQAGEPVRIAVAWRNDGPGPVRIPADWASKLEVRATWIDPNGPRIGHGSGRGTPRVDAATVAWAAVAPGASVTTTIDLATPLPEHCRPGCETGTYEVSVGSWPVDYTNAADDQMAVTGHAAVDVVVAPVITRRPAAEVLAVGVVPRRVGSALEAELTLTNVADAPVWVSPDWLGGCTWTGRGGGGGTTTAAGGQAAWVGELAWVRLVPTEAYVVRVPCGDAPKRTKGLEVRLDLAPLSGFLPLDPHPGELSAEGPLGVAGR